MAVAGSMFGWTMMDSKQHLNDPSLPFAMKMKVCNQHQMNFSFHLVLKNLSLHKSKPGMGSPWVRLEPLASRPPIPDQHHSAPRGNLLPSFHQRCWEHCLLLFPKVIYSLETAVRSLEMKSLLSITVIATVTHVSTF